MALRFKIWDVDSLAKSMSSRQFSEWLAYFRYEDQIEKEEEGKKIEAKQKADLIKETEAMSKKRIRK